jgi:hypothetical protein
MISGIFADEFIRQPRFWQYFVSVAQLRYSQDVNEQNAE